MCKEIEKRVAKEMESKIISITAAMLLITFAVWGYKWPKMWFMYVGMTTVYVIVGWAATLIYRTIVKKIKDE